LIYLIDSNILLWWFAEPHKLTMRVHALLADPANEVFVSEATIWELATKINKGKLTNFGASIQVLLDEIVEENMTLLPIKLAHILRTEALPHHHRDPFDRMLIAQAMEEKIPLIASDEQIQKYDLAVIWE
jgi:PIN domain nuclease of toxin-antitoxin system